jgi:hypothetical protein
MRLSRSLQNLQNALFRSSIQPIIDQQLNTKKYPQTRDCRIAGPAKRKLEKRDLMHGYNNINTLLLPAHPQRIYLYQRQRIPVPSKSLMSTKTRSRPSYTLPFSRFLFFYPGLLRRLFGSFSPTLACFSLVFPASTGLLLSPSVNFTSTGSLCLSLRLFSLAHLPFQLPAGMHVTSPFCLGKPGYGIAAIVPGASLYPTPRHHPLFCFISPPPLPPFASSSLPDSMHVPVSYK